MTVRGRNSPDGRQEMSFGTASRKATFQDDQTTDEKQRTYFFSLLMMSKLACFFFLELLHSSPLLHQKAALRGRRLLCSVALFSPLVDFSKVDNRVEEPRLSLWNDFCGSANRVENGSSAPHIAVGAARGPGARRSEELQKSLRRCVGRLWVQRVFFFHI